MPDYAMILIGANMGMNKMTKEHLGICLAIGIPFFIVITKIDIAPEQVYEKTKATLQKILKLVPHRRKLEESRHFLGLVWTREVSEDNHVWSTRSNARLCDDSDRC